VTLKKSSGTQDQQSEPNLTLSTDFGKNANIKFHKNLSSRSHAVPCGQKDGWTATHSRTNSCFSQLCECT